MTRLDPRHGAALGSLVVVGTGMRAAGQLTPEARKAISDADEVFHLPNTRSAQLLIEALRPGCEGLESHYSEHELRSVTYRRMTEAVVGPVERGQDVCVVFYGHPGVFCSPGHEAVRRVRALGGKARMLPAISSHDSLFADIGFDPASGGCQIYEATDYLTRRTHDVTTPLVLYQPEAVGDPRYYRGGAPMRGVPLLVELLSELYGPDHPCVLYRAATSPLWKSEIDHAKVATFRDSRLSPPHTLFVPARGDPVRDAATEERLRAMVGDE